MYRIIHRTPLPAGPLREWRPGQQPTIKDLEFPTLSQAVQHFLKLANEGVRGLSIFGPDDTEVIDLREWAPQAFLRERNSLVNQIEAIEDRRMLTRDPSAAIAELKRRVAVVDVFLAQA
jgi:hypothetical protein